MNLYVGTSGYSYPQWKESFYPRELPQGRFLNYYGGRFRSVEINNTFHRMPTAALLEGWAAEVPEDFKFALKAPQRITHWMRLKGVDEVLSHFLGVAGVLRGRLGPLLFQLPPDLELDIPVLRGFLLIFPARHYRAAFEFRHPSWFNEEVYGLLRKYGAALCVSEREGVAAPPLVATADWGYLRLRRGDYEDGKLGGWARWVREQPWQDAFVYFKHEETAQGPLFAQRFIELAKQG